MNTASRIIEYITQHGQASGKEITDFLGTIGSRGVRKQLKSLLDRGKLQKVGKPPKVYYLISLQKFEPETTEVNSATEKIINERYLYVTPSGVSKPGWSGFIDWCAKTHQDPVKTAEEYINTIKKYDQFKKNGLINGLPKINKTFDRIWLDYLFYIDFYSIERFGKTKLGQILLYAKQSQNIALIRQLIRDIHPAITTYITKYNIDGVLFIPPTVKREIQLMKMLESGLQLPIRKLSVAKIRTDIVVPQKTLSKLEDRVENASHTIIVEDVNHYNNILIIDDAVGSGATLNETAKQIRNKKLTKGLIIGLAITGSYKGFDVISEV